VWEGRLRPEGAPDDLLERLFVAGFGPFRRFTGGDTDLEKQFAGFPPVERVVSLFEERFSFAASLAWLKLLRFEELDGKVASGEFLASLRGFVNQDGLLPNGARLERITPHDVVLVDGTGAEVPIDEMSDGYRSALSLTFELIRQLAAHYGPDRVFDPATHAVSAPGIVLIDEVDAHLHPTWQRQIGLTLRRLFPAIQFIVTTHSPLICQAADSVFHLPTPGSDEEPRMLEPEELDRLRYGNLLDAYGTGVFGRGVTRSEAGKLRLKRLAELDRREIEGALTEGEAKEQLALRAAMPTLDMDRAFAVKMP
jgi:hypothetical protein